PSLATSGDNWRPCHHHLAWRPLATSRTAPGAIWRHARRTGSSVVV
ncbi:hypothetical protein A2U01_0114930, partial [Trifolium medium]|nr:hypothetical protein [Trifolium medium]